MVILYPAIAADCESTVLHAKCPKTQSAKSLLKSQRFRRMANLVCWDGNMRIHTAPRVFVAVRVTISRFGGPLAMKLIEYIESRREEHLNELKEFLRIPSVSTKSEHKPDIERAAHWVAEKLRAAGLENVEIMPTKMHPLVYGESLHAPGKPTILFYGHYDVQPAEPLDLWTSPGLRAHRARRQSFWARHRRRQRPGAHPPQSARSARQIRRASCRSTSR